MQTLEIVYGKANMTVWRTETIINTDGEVDKSEMIVHFIHIQELK